MNKTLTDQNFYNVSCGEQKSSVPNFMEVRQDTLKDIILKITKLSSKFHETQSVDRSTDSQASCHAELIKKQCLVRALGGHESIPVSNYSLCLTFTKRPRGFPKVNVFFVPGRHNRMWGTGPKPLWSRLLATPKGAFSVRVVLQICDVMWWAGMRTDWSSISCELWFLNFFYLFISF